MMYLTAWYRFGKRRRIDAHILDPMVSRVPEIIYYLWLSLLVNAKGTYRHERCEVRQKIEDTYRESRLYIYFYKGGGRSGINIFK